MFSKLFLRKALCALLRFRPCNGPPFMRDESATTRACYEL
jgi:hypothetical protein